MHILPSYSMLASTATTLMLSIIFLILSQQGHKHYMRFWGISWLVCSVLFLLDFINLQIDWTQISYIMFRQLISLMTAYLFLLGTFRFFQHRIPTAIHLATAVSAILIVIYPASFGLYRLALIPNTIFCSGLLILSGCMFISFSWTQKLPEKLAASFFIILWSIFINHFGFTLRGSSLAFVTYYIGLLTVNIVMLILIIIYFKKLRFTDSQKSQRFRTLVENSSDSMFLYDYGRQSFEYISPAIQSLIGLSDRQLYTMPERFFDYINVATKSSDIVNLFSRPILTPGNGVLCLYEDGEIKKWSAIHYMPIRDNTGTVVAVEGILRDITERKLMEQELEAASTAKRELLENISHEIKTPVTLIQGYTESLLDKIVPVESTDMYLKMIRSKANVLTTLLNDLAQASDLTSQSLEFKFYEHDAEETFQELVHQGQFHIESSNHKSAIQVNILPSAMIIMDPQRIQQVISNLINNAIRHTPAGQEISITCITYLHEELIHSDINNEDMIIPDGELLFTVSDTGDGIPEEDLPHIFERNFSGGRKIRTTGAQSGLGLHISNQIITQHSGRMFAKNNQNGGADISFTLPLYRQS